MPKLRPAPSKPEEVVEEPQTYYGAEKPKEPFESKDDTLAPDGAEGTTVVLDKKPAQDDSSLALKKQIDDLRRSEQLQREAAERALREREEALSRANARERENFEVRREVVASRMDAIKAGMAAAQAEAETAQRDLENAVSIGDTKAQAEAYRKLARAEANLSKMEDGKLALEEELQRQATEKAPVAQPDDDPLANSPLPELAKSWLRAHPDYLREPRKNAKIQALHWDLIDEGHQPFSQQYFESMEIHLGLRKAERTDDDYDGGDSGKSDDQRRGTVVSAPVSREAPAGSRPTRPSQIRLTKAQVEAARMAGVTEAEYAKQLVKLGEFKADGLYGESR